METPLAQRQITSRELRSQIRRFLRVAIADGHVVVPDGECTDLGIRGDGEFADLGAGAVGAEDDGASCQSGVGEGCDYALAGGVESDVGQGFAVLDAKGEGG